MAPMIDMVFLLLVFFMTASAMSQAGAKRELVLPESSRAQVAKDFSQRMIVSVDEEGRFFVGQSEYDAEALSQWLEQGVGEQVPKLAIRAARKTPFSAVREVMALAASKGIDSYLYATHQSANQ